MGRIKRIFRNYNYWDCGEMARCLEDMALKGWHFKKFGLGMIFEEGEKEKVCYDVEVFPKGRNYDFRPSEDAEEYSEYCRQAGWDFIDGQRKFCVFKQREKNAIEIVTANEKFKNIKDASLKSTLFSISLILYIGVLVWVTKAPDWMFHNFDFYAMCCIVFSFVSSMIQLYMIWKKMNHYQWDLEHRGIPYYGETTGFSLRWLSMAVYLFFIVGCVLFFMEMRTEEFGFQISVGILLLLEILFAVSLYIFRPNRKSLIPFMITGFLVIVVITIGVLIGTDETFGDREQIGWQDSEVPLTLDDLKTSKVKVQDWNVYEKNSMFGTKKYYDILYQKDEEICYTIYESPHSWVLDRLWKNTKKNTKDSLQNVTKQWGAKEAYFDGWSYYVKYEDKQLNFWYSEDGPMTRQQIAVIRKKLNLQECDG